MEFENLIILSNDPSLTAWGWVIIENNIVLECGCFKTAPENKKRRIRKSDDTIRRIQELNKSLLSLIEKYKVNYILSEAPHGSQNASAAVMIGVVTGIVQTISDCKEIPVEWYSEEDAKKFVFGRKSASKTEMVTAMRNLFQIFLINSKLNTVKNWDMPKYISEAVADALAIYCVAKDQSTILKMFIKSKEECTILETQKETNSYVGKSKKRERGK